jgi:hypothetical protein
MFESRNLSLLRSWHWNVCLQFIGAPVPPITMGFHSSWPKLAARPSRRLPASCEYNLVSSLIGVVWLRAFTYSYAQLAHFRCWVQHVAACDKRAVSLSHPFQWSYWSNFQKSLGNVKFVITEQLTLVCVPWAQWRTRPAHFDGLPFELAEAVRPST